MTSYRFRRLESSDLDAALAILVEVTQWLQTKGVRQWIQPIPREIYEKRVAQGENYGLFVDKELAAVVSLMNYRPEYWSEHLPETGYRWMATLASARKFKGQRLGELTISEAEHFLRFDRVPAIYLDCVYGDGALAKFYSDLGYQTVARKDVSFPWGTFDSVLMRKKL